MGKYILLIVGILVAYWLVKHSLRRKQNRAQRKTMSDDMVRCAQCGVALPRGESLATRNLFFCCAEHQRSHGDKS